MLQTRQIFRKCEEPLADDATEGAEASRLAVSAVTRLARLKTLRAQHALCQLPAAAGLVDSEIKQLSRGIHAGGREESQLANEKLSGYMDGVVAKEKKLLAKRQAAATKKKGIVFKQAAQKRVALRKKKRAAKAKAELQAKLDKLPRAFRADECGKPGAPGETARAACLERLKLRSPSLPFALEVAWKDVRNRYSKAPQLRASYKLKATAPVGHAFIEEVNSVLRLLGEHCTQKTRFNEKGEVGGDPLAFQKFVQRAQEAVAPPRAATVAYM